MERATASVVYVRTSCFVPATENSMSSTSFVGRSSGLMCCSCCMRGSTKIIMSRVASEHPGVSVAPLALPAAMISPLNCSSRGAE
eukprot:5218870-Amphidinium_carterae.1